MLRLIGLLIGIACLAADTPAWVTAQREAMTAITVKARRELADDPDSERGRTLVAVLAAVYGREINVGKPRRNDPAYSDREFADYLTVRAKAVRNHAAVGRTDLAIVFARVALLYNPDLANAQILVPREAARLSMDELLGRTRERREELQEYTEERQDERDLAAALAKIELDQVVFVTDRPSDNLNLLIKTAFDHDVPLRVDLKRIPLMSAGTYRGARLYQSSRLTGPRQDVTLVKTNLAEMLRTFCRTHSLGWYADGQTVVITDMPVPAATARTTVAASGDEKSLPRLSYSGGELLRAFEQSVSGTLTTLKGRQVRVTFSIGRMGDVKWTGKVLATEYFRLDMWNGSPEDIARCVELARAAADQNDNRGNRRRIRVVVTGEVYNYVSGVVYMRQPSQLNWEWATDKPRQRR